MGSLEHHYVLNVHSCQPPRAHVSFHPAPQPKWCLGEQPHFTEEEAGWKEGKTLTRKLEPGMAKPCL